MTTSAHENPMLLPRPPGGLAPGAVLSLLVHGALIAALTVAVDWRMKSPETVSAELWSSVPQIAAPRAEAPPPPAPAPAPAPEPAPPPPVTKQAAPPPDITIEREAEKRRKEEQLAKQEQARKEEAARKKEDAAREKAAAEAERQKREAAQAKAEDARLAKARDEQMKRMLGSLQGGGSNPAGNAPKDAGPSQAYVDKLRALLRNSVIFPDNGGPNATVEVRVRATASGTIISHNIVRKSGNDEFDDAVQRGLDRLGTLPRDSDGRVPTDILIVHRLRDQ